jgi:hypothetical protein
MARAMVETGITPDFITVDGGEGGTGAAPPEFSNSVGMPMLEGLSLVHSFLVGAGLRDRVKIIASGRGPPHPTPRAHRLSPSAPAGVRVCHCARRSAPSPAQCSPGSRSSATSRSAPTSATLPGPSCSRSAVSRWGRARWPAAGTRPPARPQPRRAQALKCNTNKCPTGIATQDLALQVGLDPADKAVRVYNYHRHTVHAAAEIIGAAGYDDPALLQPRDIYKRLAGGDGVMTYKMLTPRVQPGELLQVSTGLDPPP